MFIFKGIVEGDTAVPFTIEWIPDILPQSKFGEMTLHYQFGHQRHPAASLTERNGPPKRLMNGVSGQTGSVVHASPRRKKQKIITISDAEAKDLQNLNNIELDFDGVAPLNDSEFQELTKSVP